MKLFATLTAVVLLATTPAPAAQAIVGGVGSTPGTQIYFVASLQSTTQPPLHHCGGVLIAKSWIITGNECVRGKTPQQLKVRTGSTRYRDGGSLSFVTRIVSHSAGDVALVQLASTSNATPAVIADESASGGTSGRVLGWGQTCPDAGCRTSEILREVAGEVEPGSVCGGASGRLCVSYPSGGGPCFGDEGGPMMAKVAGEVRLAGVVPGRLSAGRGCDEGRSSMIDVTLFRDWIRQYTG